ncbi:hypothetical protein O0235_05715 [Tepidiforma flava]|uniref:Uncharacterized protein n=1 Tax=Tepidiforma flava TaxID=3004094 RepID=A0ABY7MAF2_9CHLR|nr:hypothetical protein [Tepidiforma flava]WBL37062.1 hypothetical protein O0235_05715 [Tepidiforma flava]
MEMAWRTRGSLFQWRIGFGVHVDEAEELGDFAVELDVGEGALDVDEVLGVEAFGVGVAGLELGEAVGVFGDDGDFDAIHEREAAHVPIGVLLELEPDGGGVALEDPGAGADGGLGRVEAAFGFLRHDPDEVGVGEDVEEGGVGLFELEDDGLLVGVLDGIDEGDLGAVGVGLSGGAAPGVFDVVGIDGAAVDGGDVVELDVGLELDGPGEAVGAGLGALGDVGDGAEVGLADAGAGVVLEEAAVDVGGVPLGEEGEVAVGVDGGRVAGEGDAVGAAALGVGEGVGRGRGGLRAGRGRGEPGEAAVVVITAAAANEGEACGAGGEGGGTAEEAAPGAALLPEAVPV